MFFSKLYSFWEYVTISYTLSLMKEIIITFEANILVIFNYYLKKIEYILYNKIKIKYII